MRVFVTGASGWIGSAVVPELLGAGHQVVGLARSDDSAKALDAAGAEVHRGSLDDLAGLREAAAASDGVIHLAFKHDQAFTGNFEGAATADRAAIETFGDALAGSDRPFLIASGTLGLTTGKIATELDGRADDQDLPALPDGPNMRRSNAHLTLSFADRGVRASVVRLPPTVHGDGDNGFIASLIAMDRDNGVSGYLGDGSNRWPAVHRFDAAVVFRLALEQAPAGSVLHAVADQGVPVREVAEVIGRHLGIAAESVAPERLAWLAGFLGVDGPASSELTRSLLGWSPTHPGLIDDLEAGHYFS